MTARTQGYLFVLITMCIWGGFTIFSRLNLHWHVSAWDLVAMRFAIAFFILIPLCLNSNNVGNFLKWLYSTVYRRCRLFIV